MTPTDRLRAAANLMRERASAATPGPWHISHSGTRAYSIASLSPNGGIHGHVMEASSKVSAEHITSWHPAVALTVADWLDHEADRLEYASGDDHPDFVVTPGEQRRALAVADAYLHADAKADAR